MAGLNLGGDPGTHDLVVLSVDPGQAAGVGDGSEGGQQLSVGDTREPLRVGLEGRQLEGGGAGGHERLHILDPPAGRDGGPQSDIDVGRALHVGHLVLERVE